MINFCIFIINVCAANVSVEYPHHYCSLWPNLPKLPCTHVHCSDLSGMGIRLTPTHLICALYMYWYVGHSSEQVSGKGVGTGLSPTTPSCLLARKGGCYTLAPFYCITLSVSFFLFVFSCDGWMSLRQIILTQMNIGKTKVKLEIAK